MDSKDDHKNYDCCEKFHELEKQCIGYDNFVNCEEKNYLATLEGIRKLVIKIQGESLFSINETLDELPTENLKLLMAPFYQADLLYRIMDNRGERIKLAHIFYLEYLRLLSHYGVLSTDQTRAWKLWMNRHKVNVIKQKTDACIEELKEIEEILSEIAMQKKNPYEDREAKIAEFKNKKLISQQMDALKDYKDEEMKREFYMAQINQSVYMCFE